METLLQKAHFFPHAKQVEPKSLISFSEEYLQHIPSLEEYLLKHKDKIIELPVTRLALDGTPLKKTFTGTLREVNLFQNRLVLETISDFDSTYEEPRLLVIRWDNVLGIIPHLEKDLQLFAAKSEKFKLYIPYLKKMRELLRSVINKEHHVSLHFRYKKDKQHDKYYTHRKGDYHVLAEIKTVNKSNVEYLFLKSVAYVNQSQKIIELGRKECVDLFITPERYLSGVRIYYSKFTESAYDLNEY